MVVVVTDAPSCGAAVVAAAAAADALVVVVVPAAGGGDPRVRPRQARRIGRGVLARHRWQEGRALFREMAMGAGGGGRRGGGICVVGTKI